MGFLDGAMQRCADGCDSPNPSECVPDSAVITHYGIAGLDPEFKHAPNVEKEPGLSVQGVEKTADEMCELVHGMPSKANRTKARVRYSSAGVLRAAGFAVIHTPGRFENQRSHITVIWPPEEPFSDPSAEWPKEVSEAFDACFNA